jgi:predicted transcriptional regulator
MNEQSLALFKEVLNCLRYSGTTVKAFAQKINMKPQTLYNYRNGQRPSPQGFRYIIYMIQKICPEALSKGIEIYKASQQDTSILKDTYVKMGLI